jgi:3-oxoacyl-[acyl-carrier protein] reductase
MDFNLQNKKVLIVGASKGIGKAIALAFSSEKANLALVARSTDLLLNLKEECLARGALSVSTYSYDVMDGDNQAFAHQLLSELGHFDVIVHCVGGSLTSRNIFGGSSDYAFALKFNALYAVDMNSVFIPDMIQAKIQGRVIHISSISAKMLRGNPLYASAKAFLNAYVITAGREVASKGILMTSVMPGAVSFPDSYWDLKVKENSPAVPDFLRQHQAIGRFGTPEEIANLVVFLASDKSSFICASCLPADGGNM